jgi:hypothetical protein
MNLASHEITFRSITVSVHMDRNGLLQEFEYLRTSPGGAVAEHSVLPTTTLLNSVCINMGEAGPEGLKTFHVSSVGLYL